jgi:hypothetical protein
VVNKKKTGAAARKLIAVLGEERMKTLVDE